MMIKAILWDGYTKINGFINIREHNISFQLIDFNESNLNLEISYQKIKEIKPYRLFSHEVNGIEIIGDGDKRNVFIVEHPNSILKEIESLIEISRKMK